MTTIEERASQLIAHRACGNQEQDPPNGKLAGYCVVCQVPWPCDTAKPFAASELSVLQRENENLKVEVLELDSLRTQNRELEEENENLSSELALRIGDKLEITTLGKQNRKLRELLTDVLKSSDAMWYEKQMGHDWNDCVDRINKALALQPEK